MMHTNTSRAFKAYFALVFIALLLLSTPSVLASGAGLDLPPESVKKLPQAPEDSVSTYVPSEVAPGQGLAVNIIYPHTPRYGKDGAPVAVLVPGGEGASGLRFAMHAPQAGFVEVRFAFPGGGLKQFHSGGSWDERGKDSQKALRDVLLFAHGEKADINGKSIGQLLPIPVDLANVGAVGWDNGGNILLVTMARYPLDLGFLKWIAFYESPIGSLFSPSALGNSNDLLTNRHYRQGSAATGTCLIDFRKLAWEPGVYKNRAEATKMSRKPAAGILFFDENGNKVWEESQEFALSYACAPRSEKQYYAPEVLKAARRLKVFGSPEPEKDVDELKKEKEAGGKAAAPKRGGILKMLNRGGAAAKAGSQNDSNDKPEAEASERGGTGTGKGKPAQSIANAKPKKPRPIPEKPGYKLLRGMTETEFLYWPEHVATVEEAEAFFQDRDGSLYIKQIPLQYPDLLVSIFGSRLDHDQRQPDHPHIAFNYNLWLANKPRWLRLNPDPRYIAYMSDVNPLTFSDNEPNSSIDASTIESLLEPEGFLSDQLFMQATIAELADRARSENFRHPLAKVINDYLNDEMKAYLADLASKRAQTATMKKQQQNASK